MRIGVNPLSSALTQKGRVVPLDSQANCSQQRKVQRSLTQGPVVLFLSFFLSFFRSFFLSFFRPLFASFSSSFFSSSSSPSSSSSFFFCFFCFRPKPPALIRRENGTRRPLIVGTTDQLMLLNTDNANTNTTTEPMKRWQRWRYLMKSEKRPLRFNRVPECPIGNRCWMFPGFPFRQNGHQLLVRENWSMLMQTPSNNSVQCEPTFWLDHGWVMFWTWHPTVVNYRKHISANTNKYGRTIH